jgi:hypothetical protein
MLGSPCYSKLCRKENNFSILLKFLPLFFIFEHSLFWVILQSENITNCAYIEETGKIWVYSVNSIIIFKKIKDIIWSHLAITNHDKVKILNTILLNGGNESHFCIWSSHFHLKLILHFNFCNKFCILICSLCLCLINLLNVWIVHMIYLLISFNVLNGYGQ